ncbi:uncharacterized protein LOC113855104 isoform X3 [Abrus precatorius]|uniref:Uncharacterized protein LOC113855104 isoform X2 n=1 Tax=Abrus precatorius TaxID=3816 RepID=A0A8B8KF14_ABRPR|nr:uncharacterized protein LOC113855104 isoform X2 [Abrus precatorius]XP_027342386.1 uncharacterized protein LOC113855104 isoform X3 [Abrus precatorius]
MDECHTRKRVRPDSDCRSPDSSKHPRVRADSDVNSSESSDGFHLGRVEPVLDSSGVNEIQDDLFSMLNDAENVTDRDPIMPVQGLDSVIKSFEEEILAPGSDPNPNLTPEFNPNLGYLLEASDDELGLPPTITPTEETGKEDSCRVGPEGVDLTGFLGFEDDIGSYEGFGLVGCDGEDNGGGYVTIDGLFDYAEAPADILWRSESLQAM